MTSFSLRAVPAACAALALLICPRLVLAQDMPVGIGDTPARPQQGSRLERVELSSRQQSDTDLRRKSQVAKQIYGREEMDKYGDTNVSDVLKRLPGVSVQDGSPRMRGLGAGYTLILINGDPAPPGFALDQLSPSQVERIEVTKGPTADQSAQAVAGAINIILKDAPRVSQRDLRLGVGYSIERPTPNANFTLGETLGPLALSLPISAFEWRNQNSFTTERFAQGIELKDSQVIQHAEQPNWGHGFNIAPRVNWKISDDESASFQTFAQKGFWNNKTDYVNTVLSGKPSLDDDSASHGTWQNLRGNVQWVNRFNDAQRLELKAGVQDSKGTFNSETFRSGAVQRQTVGNNHDRSLTQAGKFGQLLGEDHSLTVGWDLEWRKRDELRTVTENGVVQLPQYDGQPFSADIQRQALFVQDEWELSKQWSTYLGLRAERIATESRGNAETVRNTSQVVTPLWHLNYKLDPKGRDLIRASLTRSYKAPDLNALLARPSLSGQFPDTSKPNTELSPDRVGNPELKPELATGLDIAFEKYFTGGGMFSVGLFHRSINDLIRSTTNLQTVEWSPVQRWVTQPVNYSKAQTSGLELEVKGRAGELLPSLFDPKLALNLRGSLSFYHSNVDAVPGPNNRLDGQQPWSGNLGFDYRLSSLPLTTGASFSVTPGYTTQQTISQSLEQTRTRALDVFAQWAFSKTLSLRLSANNLAPLDTQQTISLGSGYGSTTDRVARTNFGAALEIKL
ncbi:TonB-dependent receptor [Paucibacter sp. B2R-40]|uniref:TonB-dependent receptor plug domain-containing protein n=1 Tax=Paucibacter sp. B2R-40 TaxID=2893554 RepID=UPI0021E475F5|nr:TonB-dependent receptor [Paucibacter sp. B2R-40]MCV2354762.1 TonB-dependent receptor [Paucibacter sp. B2R-40]